jgi:magnesium-transporting ATPase (P-type)
MHEVDEFLKQGKSKKKGNNAAEALKAASNSQNSDIHTLDFEGIGEKLELKEEKPWLRTADGFQGLSSAFAGERLAVEGTNELIEKGGNPWYVNFCKEMTGFFALLLWFGSFLCFIAYGVQETKTDKSNLYLGIVLAAVTFITGCFSYQ